MCEPQKNQISSEEQKKAEAKKAEATPTTTTNITPATNPP
jgi:hypothetical protein